MAESSSQDRNHLITIGIGFFSILLLILVISLVSRIVMPRIETTRAGSDSALISDVIQIEVLNGCGVAGVATRFTNALRRYGFDVVEIGNFDHFDVQQTLVISRSGDMATARRVATALGVTEEQILQQMSRDFYLDITIVIGADFERLKL